jgi:hypothetical protein
LFSYMKAAAKIVGEVTKPIGPSLESLNRRRDHLYRKGSLGQVRFRNRGVPVLDIGGTVRDDRLKAVLTTINS